MQKIIQKLKEVFSAENIHAFFDVKTIKERKMAIAWGLALVIVFIYTMVFRAGSVSFNGIAEATQFTVSVPSAVEIEAVHVQVGQEIHDGDTLVELNRPDLELRINEVKREMDALQGHGTLSSANIDQKVAEIQADLNTRRNTLRFEIKRMQDEYDQNLKIAKKLKSVSGTSTTESNAMAMQIKSKKQELAVLESNAATQIRLLRGSKGKQEETNTAELETLQKELEMLTKEREEQTILANGDWVVAEIFARDGEKLSSFTPIMTLTRKAPTQVRGYLNETYYDNIEVGALVEVSSQVNRSKVRGRVLGMSSQIVPFPLRLLKMPDMPIYGREVNISIPENNGFLLGEKVSISEVPGWKRLLSGDDDDLGAKQNSRKEELAEALEEE